MRKVPIEQFEDYEVTDDGRIWSKRRRRYLKPLRENGNVTLYNNEESLLYTPSVAKVVAQAFVPNPNNYNNVRHKDGNANNNRAENLEWCKDHPRSRPVEYVDEEGYTTEYTSAKEAEQMTGVSRKHILYICEHYKGRGEWRFAD